MFLSGQLVLTPTDLSAFLGCRHRTALDLAVLHGGLAKPTWTDPFAQSLADRGIEHEQRYLDALRADGRTVVEIPTEGAPAAAVTATRAAMAGGADVIYQAGLEMPGWFGRADVLVRVDRPSALGAWSYEPHDTKLARETRGGAILQLSAYAEMLGHMQGVMPERFHVVMPAPSAEAEPAPAVAAALAGAAGADTLPLLAVIDHAATSPTPTFRVESFRVADYAAYYRRVRADLLASVAAGHERGLASTYPDAVDACEVCRWWARCHDRRRADDHLSFVAGMSRTHAAEFVTQQAPTLAAVAALPAPLPFTPTRGSRETFERLRDQARLQHQQRTSNTPVHELLPMEPGLGLCRLPAPSPGDVFLDLEGAPFAREGGREYLFGLWCDGAYQRWWAFDDPSERAVFERVMDLIEARWAADPGMHVYHFAPYEPSAFKRLMGRYATRADLLDRLLRGERFVDLLAVTRQALRAGVEGYSIKQLEPFYGYTREVPLTDARQQLTTIELALESHAAHTVPVSTREAVAGYNADDCRSTEALRDWLEQQRAEAIAAGADVPRPTPKEDAPAEDVGALEARQQALRERLLDGLPADAHEPGVEGHERWLLAYLIDWHRREEKVDWWEHFRLAALAPDDLFDEASGVAGLEFVERVDVVRHKTSKKPTGSVIDRYRYPLQETEVGRGKVCLPGGQAFGDITEHDRVARTLLVKKSKSVTDRHPPAVFASDVVRTVEQQKSLLRLAERVDEITCGMDLLHRRPPRLSSGSLEALPGESTVDRARRLALALDRTTLAVQGPPGAGKTYIGAQMIRALVAAGKRVGVVASSHKVIVHLLEAVAGQASAAGESIAIGRKLGSGEEQDAAEAAIIRGIDDNAEAREAIASGAVQVLGGTAWLWSREEFAVDAGAASPAVDVLVVDEAGQFSLANALAVSPAASSLVLLGDPQQLQQPQKGSHPDGVDVSALQHVLGGVEVQTMPADRGLFLPVTWRLAPSICTFTSEQFYEARLDPRDGLDRQRLEGTDGLDGAGLMWITVSHTANRHWSAEEIDAVDALVSRLLVPGAQWVTVEGSARPLQPDDILVVAPYNAHVNRLTDRLAARGVRVGTVDKFQGQEAPVVIYAMAASTPQDAPRGMEFLYSRHRLNVATSRARCRAFVVASPALLAPECRTPRQMLLANALCRFAELAGA